MKKLRLFFMTALATLFVGTAFAEGNVVNPGETGGNDGVPYVDPDDTGDEFAITLEIGNGQDNFKTGISQNAKAFWAADMAGENFFDTPRDLNFTYQLLTDGGQGDGEEITKETQLLHKAGTPALVEKQFVMDPLVPNRLYKVKAWVEDEANDTIYTSDWYYFISAIPSLVSGKLVWNWANEENAEDQAELFEDDLADDNGGTLKWFFSEFANHQIGEDEDGNPKYETVDGVTGYVEVYENDELVGTYTGTENVTNSYDMTPTKTYELKSYATYKYEPGTIVYSQNGVYVERGEEIETDPFASESRGPQTWQGTSLDPSNIHVGPWPWEEEEQTHTLVVVDHLRTTAPANECIGRLEYWVEGVKQTTVVANLNDVPGNRNYAAAFLVPTTKDFDFRITLTSGIPANGTEYGYDLTMPEDEDGNPIKGHVTQGTSKNFDIADRHLLWNDGSPVFTISLKEDEVDDARRSDFVLTFRMAGGQNPHTENGHVTNLGDEENPEWVVMFDLSDWTNPNMSTMAENKDFEFISIEATGRQYDVSMKKEWKFFTGEGCHVLFRNLTTTSHVPGLLLATQRPNGTNREVIDCEHTIFAGDVIALDPRNGDEPLMDVTDATKPAPLYFYDWAWTPKTAPVIKDIQIEHMDEVTFTTTNETRDEDTDVTMKSQVKYTLPTKYNNAQTIGSLTVYDFVKQADMKAMKDWVNKAEGVVPTEDEVVVNEENGFNADWGKTLFAKGYEYYGPYTLYTVAEGEVPEGKTTWDHNCFTMAPRQGKINLGSTIYDEEGNASQIPGWDEVLDAPLPPVVQTVTTENHVLTVEPQFVISNIFNWNYLKDEDGNTMFDGECGQCNYTIYAWLETPTGEIASHGTTTFSETSATGSVTKLGQVVFNTKLYFVNVEYDTEYTLKGYMLYEPQRYTLLTPKTACTPLKDAEVGPVVKVPFEYSFRTSPEMPDETPEDNTIEYWIAEEDFEGNAGQFVEVRIYDPDEVAGAVGSAAGDDTELKLICQLIPATGMPAVATVPGKWEPATDTERGYYKFIFPVDNDGSTTDVLKTYHYGFSYYYEQGSLSTDAKTATDDEGINTPDPYRTFTKHAPASAGLSEAELTTEVGPWTLKTYSESLTNFFAFTEQYLPSSFKNWEEYWGNPEIAWNLVYGYTDMAVSAPAMRGAETKAVKTNYAPTVKLKDAKNAAGVRYEYFNDEEFEAGKATYSADYTTYKNLRRSVVVPFDATTDASVYWMSSAKLDDTGSKISFLFSQRKVGGVPFNGVKATIPYVAIAAAKGMVDFVGEDVTIHKSNDLGEGSVEVRRDGELVFYAYMQGLYAATWNQDIVPDPDQDGYQYDWYRYYDGSCLALPKKGDIKDEAAGTYWDASYKDGKTREWQPNFAGVNAFECYFYILDNGYTSGDFSISFRFEGEDDDDATVIENINVEVESSEMFDLQGRKVLEPVKGQIYIQNGKKILF